METNGEMLHSHRNEEGKGMAQAPYKRYLHAVTPRQKNSLAELKETYKYALYEDITTENRENYFGISVRPITKKAEDDMELLSDLVTWGEEFRYHWKNGVYKCAQCSLELFDSKDKWEGPCVWPSFRKPFEKENVDLATVTDYNNYSVTVKEVYCKKCNLFIGHAFEDGKAKGDVHPNAHWRF
jgi:peptide-methionine (R)-S-oxide reductase